VRLSGAGRPAVLLLGVLPAARTGLVSLLLYQLECNVRRATVLGIVGAGGLGQDIDLSLRLFDYARWAPLWWPSWSSSWNDQLGDASFTAGWAGTQAAAT